MSKRLIIINGPAGVGKTSICKELYTKLDRSVWLDGDWCWMIHPFEVTDANIRMAEKNISFMLQSFVDNPSIRNIIFCWVLHKEAIHERIFDSLSKIDCEMIRFSLLCSPESLQQRMLHDNRNPVQISKSISRLKLYQSMNTIKIDTTNKSIAMTVEAILQRINHYNCG